MSGLERAPDCADLGSGLRELLIEFIGEDSSWLVGLIRERLSSRDPARVEVGLIWIKHLPAGCQPTRMFHPELSQLIARGRLGEIPDRLAGAVADMILAE